MCGALILSLHLSTVFQSLPHRVTPTSPLADNLPDLSLASDRSSLGKLELGTLFCVQMLDAHVYMGNTTFSNFLHLTVGHAFKHPIVNGAPTKHHARY